MTKSTRPIAATGSVFVGGIWRQGKSEQLTSILDPSTEASVGTYYDASVEDVDEAVQSASSAFHSGEWSNSRKEDRIAVLMRLAELFGEHQNELEFHAVSELGIPTGGVGPHVVGARDFIERTVEVAQSFKYEERRADGQNNVLVVHEPVGVVAAIMPFNAPFTTPVIALAPALLAGCTVVWKPDPQVALSAFALARLFQDAGLPDGVLNLVAGGPDVGRRLVRHEGIHKVTFTGSSAAGQDIAAACGVTMKRVTLELGGKSAAILLDDADLESALPTIMQGALANNGQTCYAIRRLLVPRRLHHAVVGQLAERMRQITVGNAHDVRTQMGPLASSRQLERVMRYIELGSREGARLVAGGKRPEGCDRGWFVGPTLFDSVENHMTVAQEEIFGPVLLVETYDNEEQALEIADDSPYGLSGSVFTSDAAHGVEIARKIRTGTFSVNCFGVSTSAPFGGFKQSGLGRKYGPEGFAQYMEPKSILIPNEALV
jgi:aldehyde dehydrogenase (NAD+)